MLCSGLERPKAELRECHHQLDEPHEGRILAEVPCKADSLQCFGMEEGKKAFSIQQFIDQLPIGSCLCAGDLAVDRGTQMWMVSRHC